MNYTDYIAQLAALLVIPADGERFLVIEPWIISYAELSMYRDPDFDFLATRGPANTSSATAQGSRYVAIPDGFIVVEQVNLIVPQNVTTPVGGTRVPLLRTSRAYLDITWPEEAVTKSPAQFETYYAINDQQDPVQGFPNGQFIIAPTVDGAYTLEVYGTHRPAPLSATNPQTFLTTFLPDLFMAKSMVIATGGILKNFGAQADDPQMAASWGKIYDDLRRGAAVESMRQKAISSGWSAFPPAPLAPTARSSPPPPPAPPGAPGG